MTAYTVSGYRNTSFDLATTDQLTVTNQGSIVSTGAGPAILGAGSNGLSLDGFVYAPVADGGVVRLNSGSNSVAVGRNAHVIGGHSGLSINGGSNSITNAGEIIGSTYGVTCSDGSNSIVNAGTIFGRTNGINLSTGTTNSVVNTGQIVGGSYAVASAPALSLTNSGTIDGFTQGISCGSTDPSAIANAGFIYGRSGPAIETGGGADTVVNNGFVHGNVYAVSLDSGDDFFDGRNGVQVGTVQGESGSDVLYGGASFDDLRGGAGNDHISGGASADYLDGGADFDFVRYDFATAAVTVNLATPAVNAGEAAGDVVLNFEGIVGSNFDDMLIGNGAANTIDGGLGADAIAGGAGVDTLSGGGGGDILFGEAGGDLIIGGAGGDIIRGGLGGDLIVLNAGDNGDLILNFNEGGVRDGFDLRGYFDATGYAGTDPRGAGLMQVLQNGADTDVYLHGAFTFRIEGVVAAAVDDTYFLFQ